MTEKSFTGVKADRPVLEAGTYNATLAGFSDVKQGSFGDPYVLWLFHPDGSPDETEVAGATSLAFGYTSKGMEWARRLSGKSSATDMTWGKDLKEKRPVINWGPDLRGSKCQIVVEKNYDEYTETHKNRVVNVLPPGSMELDEVDFSDIPF